MPFDKNLWLPCLTKTKHDLHLDEVMGTFNYSLDIPIKTAVGSYACSISQSKYSQGIKIVPEQGDVILKPPLILGLLVAQTDRVVGNPWMSFMHV